MATQLDFVTLDVFTKTPYQGNPLAIVHIPPNLPSPLTQAQKQAIAREFNLSETVFVHDRREEDDASDPKTRDIDIFLVDAEIPFAGHPTIGTAIHLRDMGGVRTLVTKAGAIHVEGLENGFLRAAIPFNTHLNSITLADLPGVVALNLHSDPEIAAAERNAPVFNIVKGMAFMLIEVPTLDHLAEIQPGQFDFHKEELIDAEWRDTFIARYYYYYCRRQGDHANGAMKIRTRMVERAMEDPATGSAACALSCYLALHVLDGSGKQRLEITQGVEMGRRSEIFVDVTTEGGGKGSRAVRELWLGGSARRIMKGVLEVPALI